MAPKRAAVYIGVASILAAWLASAAGTARRPPVADQESPGPVPTSGTEGLATDVEAQTARLRERMASAPAPVTPFRNPFTFAPRRAPAQRDRVSTPAPTVAARAVAPEIQEPPLALIGVAEEQTPKGLVRTAMVSTDSYELFMLVEGDVIGARYRVKRVDADSVELTDLVTNAIRRLSLR